jgi:hypothetical protein
MHNSPSTDQLLQAVISFLNEVATPQLTGHAQFHARVSANALALVARDHALRGPSDAQAIALYQTLLQSDIDDLASLEAMLCRAISDTRVTSETPHLLTSLRSVTVAQLAIDQPHYSGLAI